VRSACLAFGVSAVGHGPGTEHQPQSTKH
jgi:hypothetical protein